MRAGEERRPIFCSRTMRWNAGYLAGRQRSYECARRVFVIKLAIRRGPAATAGARLTHRAEESRGLPARAPRASPATPVPSNARSCSSVRLSLNFRFLLCFFFSFSVFSPRYFFHVIPERSVHSYRSNELYTTSCMKQNKKNN